MDDGEKLAEGGVERKFLKMDSHEYEKIKEVFQQAVELSPAKRHVFLDEKCGNDQNLRFQIERLLKNEDDSFMEEPLIARVAEAVVKTEYSDDLADFLAEAASDGYFSHYKIIEKIGEGGMGEVYLAQDSRLNRKVAIKVLSKHFSSDEESLKRFVHEAKSASSLNHPNIITVFETREQKDIYYVVTEFVDGETLAQKISKGKIAVLDAVNIVIQIVSALTAAHEAGIIHRDIKPDNVMIRRDGIVKVLDFGLATTTNEGAAQTDESASKIINTPGMILGTPNYMSPEQAKGQKVDIRSDIFSFGILFYKLITGNSPFRGKNQIEILTAIAKEKHSPIKDSDEKIPENLKLIIGKTLEKKPEKRYQTAKHLLADLNELKDELKFESKITQENYQTNSALIARNTEKITLRNKRFFNIPAAVVLLIAIASAISVWLFSNGAKQNQDYAKNLLSTQEIARSSDSPDELNSKGAFSLDGKTIAFTSTRLGNSAIWIKQTNSDNAVQITNDTFENKYPVFAPNGNEIAFVSNRDGENGIWRIPMLGGLPQKVTTFKDSGAILRLWSESGDIFYESEGNLFDFDTGKNQTDKLTEFDPETEAIGQIVVFRNKNRIAFVLKEDDKWKILVKEIGESKSIEIVSSENEINKINWHPDGKRIFYSALTGRTYQTFAVETDDRKPVQITFGEKDSVVQDISADGQKILFGSVRQDSDLWVADIKPNENLPIKHGDIVNLQNQYPVEGGYLDTRGRVADKPDFQRLVPNNSMFVSTTLNPNRDNSSGRWKIISATGKTEGSPVLYLDKFYLESMYPGGGYLNLSGLTSEMPMYRDFRDATYAVFTSQSKTPQNGSAIWLARVTSHYKRDYDLVTEGDNIFLGNTYNGTDLFLDTNGRIIKHPLFKEYEGSSLFVFASEKRNRYKNSGVWKITLSK